jgi:hypothetical protein
MPQGMKLRYQPAEAFGRAQVRLRAKQAHQRDQHIERLQEALGSAALVGELARRLLPRAVDLAEKMVLRDEGVSEHHLVEVVLAAHLQDRVDADARRLHVDQELREAVAAVVGGRRRSAEEPQHVVGLVGVAGPDLGAVDDKAVARGNRTSFSREEVRARAGLAHADAEAQLAVADARQEVGLDVLGRVPQEHRAALAVGDEVQPHRGIGGEEFLGDDVALEMAAAAAAVFLRPGHPDPAFRADLAAELSVVGLAPPVLPGLERAGGALGGEELADFLPQAHAFRRQPDGIEVERCVHRAAMSGQSSSAPCCATRLPSSAAHRLSLPKSSRQASRRSVKRCRMCSCE